MLTSSRALLYLMIRYSIAVAATYALLIGPNHSIAQTVAQKNSTRKIRVSPNAQSKRIGTAVNWLPDFKSAVAKSQDTGKPIFWYVPTLNGSFMDRKPEINRYMLAGPFSWPDIVDVINEHYIAVRTEPSRAQQKKYNLVPYEFIEPGFLILAPSGKSQSKIDRITTMHPTWFRNLLTRSLLQPMPPKSKSTILATAWKQFASGDFEKTSQTLNNGRDELAKTSPADAIERELLRGMAAFRLNNQVEAKSIWKAASIKYPDQPLAWKAAAEAQAIGPFSRGFEVHRLIQAKALNAGIDSKGSAAPAGTYTEKQLWENGIEFLLGMQDADGGFTECDYDFGGTDSLPNVHVAITSLVGLALLKAAKRPATSDSTRTHIKEAIRKIVTYVNDEKNINKVDRDEILWAYAYRLRLLTRCLTSEDVELGLAKTALVTAQVNAVTALQNVQTRGGGWYHEYPNPFVTATALLALHEAKQSGAKVDETKIKKGLSSLSGDRFGNGAYPYSSGRGKRNAGGTARDVAASAGRMPLCELGLYMWGQSDDETLASALQRSIELHEHLDVALKYDDHTSRMAYGGFFFWYDMRSRSEVISLIKDQAIKADAVAKQKAIIMALPELDGCFIDSHELGRVYGTAMALLSLANCE